MQLTENGTSLRKNVGVFQDLCMIYILLCAFLLNRFYYSRTCFFFVDAKFVAHVRVGVLRKEFEHVREEITGGGENCAVTNFVVCPQLRICLGVGNK